MRVITGSARGHKLKSLPGLETRPTSELVKESMMSIVQFEIEGARVLDLFAGTGQLGIEALSRGAAHTTFIDKSSACGKLIGENLNHTKLLPDATVIVADAVVWIRNTSETFDLVFADPPYHTPNLAELLISIARHVTPSGAILFETSNNDVLPQQVGAFVLKKEYRYGKRKITLYRSENNTPLE